MLPSSFSDMKNSVSMVVTMAVDAEGLAQRRDAMRLGLGPQVLRQPGGARCDLEGLQNGVSDAGLVSKDCFSWEHLRKPWGFTTTTIVCYFYQIYS